jgi:prepilin-type N-terminal cleavage/methylation domain-containing protein
VLAWRLSSKPATIRPVSTVRGFHGYGGFPKSGFTLIELLVVIGLMALMLAFAIPAFQNLGKAGTMRTAVFELHSATRLARQTAIATRQDVHVLFPDSNVSYTPETMELAYRAYALYGARDRYLTDWKMLPPGIVFERDFLTNSCRDAIRRGRTQDLAEIRNIFLQDMAYPTDQVLRFLKRVRFPGDEVEQTEMILALTFRPDGALGSAGFNPKAVYITDGLVEDGGQSVSFLPGAPVMGLEIRPESGQARIREYNQ